jgi:hypothetical protein
VLEFLHFQSEFPLNVYAGRLFIRPNASGHLLVQPYMDPMFGPGNKFFDCGLEEKQLRPVESMEKALPGQTVEVSRFAAYLGGGKPEGLVGFAHKTGLHREYIPKWSYAWSCGNCSWH